MIALPGETKKRKPRIALPGEPKVSIWGRLQELRQARELERKAQEVKLNDSLKGLPIMQYPVPPRPISQEEAKARRLREAQAVMNPTAMLKIGEELAKDEKVAYETLILHYQGINNAEIHNAMILAISVAYDKESFMKYFKFFHEGAVQ